VWKGNLARIERMINLKVSLIGEAEKYVQIESDGHGQQV
jgi:hypothetical protein